ncbi:N-6 DNA methylase [Streptacidiphilus cavernicola]|uniref:N-6 DNA methylase n=1 Tax=Streptacidiphilus cavernicola TaxID=3342716 RepID=A0ABV6VPA9_9ACTN
MDELQLDLFADLPDEPATFVRIPSSALPPRAAVPPRRKVAPITVGQGALIEAPAPPPNAPVPAKRRPRRKLGFRRPTESARDLAEACAIAWHGHHGGGRMEIPVGIVATLALLPFRGDDLVALEGWILGLDDQQLWKLYEEVWALRWIQAPHLIGRCGILSQWLEQEEPDRNLRAAVRAVTERAIQYGVLELAANELPGNLDVDLMSWMVTSLRSKGAREGLGEYHTPPEVCDMIARVTIGGMDEIRPGMSFLEPASGTGGMVRSMASALRDLGHDPADMLWVMVDIDAIAVAGAAVNAILWELGGNVAVIRGDSLAEGDIGNRAIREAAEMIEHRDRLRGTAAMVAAIQRAERMLSLAKAA